MAWQNVEHGLATAVRYIEARSTDTALGGTSKQRPTAGAHKRTDQRQVLFEQQPLRSIHVLAVSSSQAFAG